MDRGKDSELQHELAQLRGDIEKLEMEKLLQVDDIRALKAETRSYQDELRLLNNEVQSLKEQAVTENFAGNIGKEVRLRYMERYRQRMGKSIGALGYERIKRGDRAAHRGRPVIDALLCLTGLIRDPEVYPDLYGVNPETTKLWRDVPEMVEVIGFHGSLQSEGRLTKDFQVPFKRLLEVANTHASSLELKAAFTADRTLQQIQSELQDCYDKIVAANPRGRQDPSSQLNP